MNCNCDRCQKADKEIAKIDAERASAASAGYFSVPAIPEPALIESMCMRYDHGYGLKRHIFVKELGGYRDETVEEFERRQESTRITMRQLYEEVIGQGFFKR